MCNCVKENIIVVGNKNKRLTGVLIVAPCTVGMSRRIFSTRVFALSTACLNSWLIPADVLAGTGADRTKTARQQQCRATTRRREHRKESVVTEKFAVCTEDNEARRIYGKAWRSQNMR